MSRDEIKEIESKIIKKQINEFLKKGGKIKKIEYGFRAEDVITSFNRSKESKIKLIDEDFDND